MCWRPSRGRTSGAECAQERNYQGNRLKERVKRPESERVGKGCRASDAAGDRERKKNEKKT